MALAQVFEAIVGPDAPVEFQAYDGSTSGTPGSPIKITVRSPIAVSYLAQAPGALGGHKSLYSTAFYSEEEFRSRYNGAAYDKLKAEYDGGGRLLTLFDKAVRRR